MKKFLLSLLTLIVVNTLLSSELPKREFRGAWIHTVGNQNFKNMSTDSLKEFLSNTLDILQKSGVNAVIFQVRPQADAFYISGLEPWSRFVAGEQGKAPDPLWDPLEFMIREAHKRGMELHAWCNPYRVTSNDQEQLHPDHLYFRNPEIFKRYGKQLYFDPGEPEAIAHTKKVMVDIVSRYDVDAIHFDDYFYPYPEKFEEFHDDASFVKYANSQGFEYWQKADWRRNNVSTLIREINDTIKKIKPWVRFGISPFGVHKNYKDTPDGSGSKTNSLSTYEDLYADIPLWLEKGWIDYNVPQLYWKIGHPNADFLTLIKWWNDANLKGQLYIGQNISTFTEKDINDPSKTQFAEKMRLVRSLPNVSGNVWWPGWSITANTFGFTDSLEKKYQKYPALIPAYKSLDSIAPAPVTSLVVKKGVISWNHDNNNDKLQEAHFFAIYRFPAKSKVDISDTKYLIRIIDTNSFKPDVQTGKRVKYKYVITAIDRCWNESGASEILLL
ncbi:MAG: family 10 glycosylhydrolase [Rikenellaceae bacterium]|nr:family 10 glycosylhydrolase [Rikenellaceae bacterium]